MKKKKKLCRFENDEFLLRETKYAPDISISEFTGKSISI
jgi:hypothetical protein